MLPTARERARVLGLPEPTRDDLLSDARLNARLAANYLKWLQGVFDGDLEQMLIAYNAGPTKLRRWIDEAGDYASWRKERERAGSALLRYVEEVVRHQAIFAERGRIE
jgi:soluble lytic murein transglycosylase-like protein